ncbi:MAG: VOC family protein [Pseudomonadota bacterium]
MIRDLDHLVLTVADIEATCAFYCGGLGMERIMFAADRTALAFGSQKINLHQVDRTFEPKAEAPTPGSADLCFRVDDLDAAMAHLDRRGLTIIDGPVRRTGAIGPLRRTGAIGPLRSIYLRDPDGNLIELSEPLASDIVAQSTSANAHGSGTDAD